MIQSVDRAARVLHLLASGPPSLGLGEIAKGTGLAKATAHGLLRTLEHTKLVRQDAATGRYSLGVAVLELSNAYLGGSPLRARAVLTASRLSAETAEKVWVAELVAERIVVVHHDLGPHENIASLDVGASIPWYASAFGMAIVAQLPPKEITALLAPPRRALTGHTSTAARELRRRLAQVARDGYAVEDQESAVGDAAVAVAVLDAAGAPIGAIGITGPAERLFDDEHAPRHVQAVQRAANAVRRELLGAAAGR
jgi:DNA-binding IclR family transcriptional regulator